MASRLWARYERFLDEFPLLARSLTAATIAGASEAAAQSIAAALSWKNRKRSRRRSLSSSPSTSSTSSTSSPSFEARRVALWFLYGAVFSGPAGHAWQKLLASYFASSSSSSSLNLAKEEDKVGKKKKEDEEEEEEEEREEEGDDNDKAKKKKNDNKSKSSSSNNNGNGNGNGKSKELVLRVAADALLYGPFCNAVALAFVAVALEGRRTTPSPPSSSGSQRGQWRSGSASGALLSSASRAVRATLPAVQLRAWKYWPIVSLVAYSKVPPKMRVPFFNVAGFLWGVILITTSKKTKET